MHRYIINNRDSFDRINRAEGAATFEIATGKKTYYLTADCIATMEDWIRVLQNVQRRNATKLLLSKEDNKPTIQGWLTKVKNGHAKKCWCVLIGKMFLYFKCPNDTVSFLVFDRRSNKPRATWFSTNAATFLFRILLDK